MLVSFMCSLYMVKWGEEKWDIFLYVIHHENVLFLKHIITGNDTLMWNNRSQKSINCIKEGDTVYTVGLERILLWALGEANDWLNQLDQMKAENNEKFIFISIILHCIFGIKTKVISLAGKFLLYLPYAPDTGPLI